MDGEGDLGATLRRVTIRRARAADAAELTRLRGVMYDAPPAGGEDWRAAARAAFADRLANEPDTFAAGVAEDAESPGHLLSCAVGWVEPHLPSPGSPSGRRGHIANVATDPDARRRGLAAAVVAELMGFFQERDIRRVELVATPMGEGIYRRLGYVDRPGTMLTWWG